MTSSQPMSTISHNLNTTTSFDDNFYMDRINMSKKHLDYQITGFNVPKTDAARLGFYRISTNYVPNKSEFTKFRERPKIENGIIEKYRISPGAHNMPSRLMNFSKERKIHGHQRSNPNKNPLSTDIFGTLTNINDKTSFDINIFDHTNQNRALRTHNGKKIERAYGSWNTRKTKSELHTGDISNRFEFIKPINDDITVENKIGVVDVDMGNVRSLVIPVENSNPFFVNPIGINTHN